MKLFLEADFAKGNGAIRWEGVSIRLLKYYTLAIAGLAAGALVLFAKYGH